MSYQTTRREALTFIAGVAPLGGARRAESATTKGPQDFVIVEGHRDIWETTERTPLEGRSSH